MSNHINVILQYYELQLNVNCSPVNYCLVPVLIVVVAFKVLEAHRHVPCNNVESCGGNRHECTATKSIIHINVRTNLS